MSEKYTAAIEAVKKAEAAYVTAQSNLIRARRECRDAEREYLREIFPTEKALTDHFRS